MQIIENYLSLLQQYAYVLYTEFSNHCALTFCMCTFLIFFFLFLVLLINDELSNLCSFDRHMFTELYGHFGPRTLRPQDTSAPIFGAEVSSDTSAPVPKCLKTLREGAAG